MGLQYRAIRAAASALLVAAAVGTGGMTGMSPALAADPATVELSGVLLGAGDRPLAGIHLTITEEYSPDGGLASNQVVTGAGGHFSTSVFPWGTADAAATLTIVAADQMKIDGNGCRQSWDVSLRSVTDVAFADAAPTPLTLVAPPTLLGEVCGTTATPPPTSRGNSGGHPAITPPPTDLAAAALEPGATDRHGPALSLGFVLGLILAGVLLLPRPGARRRR